ncbi:MAG: amidase [Pseudomonadota bacterium]
MGVSTTATGKDASHHVAPISLIDALLAMEAGSLDAQQLFHKCADAIARSENELHALAYYDFGQTRAELETAAGPLAGIPVGVKDVIDTHDMQTEHGSPIWKDNQPRFDAAIVSMMRRAGAVLAAKTVTTEFAYLAPSPARNPHDLGHTPGGSSAGSAAGVAAGYYPIAIGTQTGGSVVRPASYCGVSGFKPSFRLLPTTGVKCFSWSLDTCGVFGARARDVAAFMEGISGRQLVVNEAATVAPRVGVLSAQSLADVDPVMQSAVDLAAALMAQSGADVSAVELPSPLKKALNVHNTIQDYEAGLACGHELASAADKMSPALRETLLNGANIPVSEYDSARRDTKNGRRACADLFADFDLILTPSAPGVAPAGNETTGSSVHNRLWTLMGTPSINVPGLYCDTTGLPTGVQLVARFGDDQRLLAAAHWLETLIGSHAPA